MWDVLGWDGMGVLWGGGVRLASLTDLVRVGIVELNTCKDRIVKPNVNTDLLYVQQTQGVIGGSR